MDIKLLAIVSDKCYMFHKCYQYYNIKLDFFLLLNLETYVYLIDTFFYESLFPPPVSYLLSNVLSHYYKRTNYICNAYVKMKIFS